MNANTNNDEHPLIDPLLINNGYYPLASVVYAGIAAIVALLLEYRNLRTPYTDTAINGYDTVASAFFHGGSFLLLLLHRRKASDGPVQDANQNQENSIKFFTGSLYQRIGCIGFGSIVLVFCFLMLLLLGKNCIFNSQHCNYWELVAVTAGGFYLYQTYFVFSKSKISVERRKLMFFGLMHLMVTNFWIAARFLVKEEKEMVNLMKNETTSSFASLFSSKQDDCHGMVCVTGHLAEFMYTCFVEYSLLCGMCALDVWIRLLRPHTARNQTQFAWSKIMNGAFLGLLVLIVSIACIFFFLAYIHSDADANAAILVFNLMEIFLLALAIISCLCIVLPWREHNRRQGDSAMELSSTILYFVALAFTMIFAGGSLIGLIFAKPNAVLITVHALTVVQVLMQSAAMFVLVRYETNREAKLKFQATAFLIIANVCLFVMDTFEPLQQEEIIDVLHTFGPKWLVFTIRSFLPIMTFYRFHSSDCFSEILKHTFSRAVDDQQQPM